MANEKSRNHEATGRNNDSNGKAQGKRDSDKPEKSAKSASAGNSARPSKKPGPGKQLRDQLNVKTESSSTGKQD